MKVRRYVLLTIGVVAVGAALVVAQTASTSTTKPKANPLLSNLKSWVGQECTVYLQMKADPRAGRSSFSMSNSDGFHAIDDFPFLVSGVLSSCEGDALVITNGARTTWIPRDQVRLISAYTP